jgi:hypothetical protein
MKLTSFKMCVPIITKRKIYLDYFFVYPLSYDSNLVDPASSHMLVLKIKPCMSKYK